MPPSLPHPMVMAHQVMHPFPRGMWGGSWRCPYLQPHKDPTHGHAPPPVECGVKVHTGSGIHLCKHAMHAYHVICKCTHALHALPTCIRHACICRCGRSCAYINAYECIFMYTHACHAYSTRCGSPSPGSYHGGGRGTWDLVHIYICV